jgi:hypothetical protein
MRTRNPDAMPSMKSLDNVLSNVGTLSERLKFSRELLGYLIKNRSVLLFTETEHLKEMSAELADFSNKLRFAAIQIQAECADLGKQVEVNRG